MGPTASSVADKDILQKLISMNWEPPIVDLFGCSAQVYDKFAKVLTWNDNLVDGQKFIKLFLSTN